MKSIVFPFFALMLSLAACDSQPPQAPQVEVACAPTDVSQECILAAGRLALGQDMSDEAWLSAGAEYAYALHASGRGEAAKDILAEAALRAEALEKPSAAAAALADISFAYGDMEARDEALNAIARGEAMAQKVEKRAKRYDLQAKFASSRAAVGQAEVARQTLLNFPEETESLAAYKARGLREVAVHQARVGDFDGAQATLAAQTMGLAYYQATARTDIAIYAFADGRDALAKELLDQAEAIGLAEENGYFKAATFRDVGRALMLGKGDAQKAMPFFKAAQTAAYDASSFQERARALSRVAAKMGDCKLYEDAALMLPDAAVLADKEEKQIMRQYSYYEIIGAAAFVGDFETALGLIETLPQTPFGSATSLKAVTKRDIAWGLARHGRLKQAVEMANSIATPRERVHAYSRILRVMNDADMVALPRYL